MWQDDGEQVQDENRVEENGDLEKPDVGLGDIEE